MRHIKDLFLSWSGSVKRTGLFVLFFLVFANDSLGFLVRNDNHETANATLIKSMGRTWILTVAHSIYINPNILGFSRPARFLEFSLLGDFAPVQYRMSLDSKERAIKINKKRDLVLIELHSNEIPLGEPIEELSKKRIASMQKARVKGEVKQANQDTVPVEVENALEALSPEELAGLPIELQEEARRMRRMDLSGDRSCTTTYSGLSGSPVFDDQGKVIGLISIANDKKQVALVAPTVALSREGLLERLWGWVRKD